MRLLSLALAAAVVLSAVPAGAQQDEDLFVKKPFSWKEDEKDRRLLNTKLMKAMGTGFKNPHCALVAGSLLAAFAEATPYFHKKDNRFALFTVFTAPLETDKFPANDYLTHMLHRAMIDGKAPEDWLTAAKAIKAKHKVPIDLGRLAYAVDGPTLIDAIDFGFATFLEHYQRQVLLAPSVALASALERFEDRYLDRDFAWPGMVLADIHREDPPKKKGRKVVVDEDEGPKYIATLLVPQQRPANDSYFSPTKIPEPMRLVVTLAPEQYIDLKKVVVSQKYLVHGRFYGFKPGKPGQPPMTVDVREGLLFEDHDWTNYGGFADASDVEQCDLAINDLSPLGLKDHQGVGDRDGFAH